MIPKQIFFIWLGNNKPDYVNFSINAFREVNPDFKIDLIEWSIEDIENPKDELLIKAIKRSCKNRARYPKIIQMIGDKYRDLLLKKYGGIYLDCDTFPVKPFDDILLNHKSFHMTYSWKNNGFIFSDIFFYGYGGKDGYDILLYPDMKDSKFKLLSDKFFKCILKYGEYYGNYDLIYINHYNDGRWKNGGFKLESCIWDEKDYE